MSVAGALELATGILVGRHSDEGFEHPASSLPLVAFQDTWVVGLSDMLIDRDLAQGLLYTPTDTIGELLLAPINLEVMKQPKVWAGLLGALALGVGASLLVSENVPSATPAR